MDDHLKKLVDALFARSTSLDLLPKITLLIEQQTVQSLLSFVSQSVQSLSALKDWTWQQFCHDHQQWISQPDYLTLFQTLAFFNKTLIFTDENVDEETKASLIIPDSIDGLFKEIAHNNDDDIPFIGIVNLWLDNLSFFIYEYPQFGTYPAISYINQYLARNYLMTDQFQFYLSQLQEQPINQSIFSVHQLFSMKTCSFSLASYLDPNVQNFPFTPEEIWQHIGKEYLQIIHIHSQTIESWSEEQLACIACLSGLIQSCYRWISEGSLQPQILFPSEQLSCDFAQALIQISSYEPFHEKIQSKRWNSETILIDIILKLTVQILKTQNMAWFFRSNLSYSDTLSIIAGTSPFEEICLCAYAVLGDILNDERLKVLQTTDSITASFCSILRQGWHHPLKKYKQLPVLQLLRGGYRMTSSLFQSFPCLGCSSLTKSDAIQQEIADLGELSLFIEISNQYPIVYDILWALSFNQDIQQQLRSCPEFMSKLAHLASECDDQQVQKSARGILWNLEINHKDHSTSDTKNRELWDMMISYSHKDKILCKQIYDELINGGYRVWIDFDQMHGNAMAQAIEGSQIVIICMSEDYRMSNYCRAEAQYAFQRQRKIVPVLLQKHYKPDGWLLFLTGQLLYVDFMNYKFDRAMEMLLKELRSTYTIETNVVIFRPNSDAVQTLPKLNLLPILPKTLRDWTEAQVQNWLTGHNLPQMSQLLANCNGRSLLYFSDYIRSGEVNQILNLVQEDSLRRTGQTISLTELSRFRSLLDEQQQQQQVIEFNTSMRLTRSVDTVDEQRCFACCRMM